MKIHRVIVTIYPPREDGYPGQVEEGYYLRKGNVVSLVSHAGVPVRQNGKTYSKALGSGEDPHQIDGSSSKNYINLGARRIGFQDQFITQELLLFDLLQGNYLNGL